MKQYQLSANWVLRFPDEWRYETQSYENGEIEHIFWPDDSDLTVRISLLVVSKGGFRAPVGLLRRAGRLAIPRSAKIDSPSKINIPGVHTTTYQNVVYENGESVTELGVLCVVRGLMLVGHIYGIDKDECMDALRHFETLTFCGYA